MLAVLSTNLVGSWLHRISDPTKVRSLEAAMNRSARPRLRSVAPSRLRRVRRACRCSRSATCGSRSDVTDGRPVVPVEAASFSIRSGERVALVGESGSGKSLTALALMGLIPAVGGEVDEASSIIFDDSNLVGMREGELRRIRGGKIGMIFQDPLSTLDPVHTVGYQIIETLRLHRPDIDGGDMRASRWISCGRCDSRGPSVSSTRIRTSSQVGCASG